MAVEPLESPQELGSQMTEGWFQVIKIALIRSSETDPFLTLVAVLVAALIGLLGGLWLILYFVALFWESFQNHFFSLIRRKGG